MNNDEVHCWMGTSSKGVGDVEGKAFAGEGAPGWEECPGKNNFSLWWRNWKVNSLLVSIKDNHYGMSRTNIFSFYRMSWKDICSFCWIMPWKVNSVYVHVKCPKLGLKWPGKSTVKIYAFALQSQQCLVPIECHGKMIFSLCRMSWKKMTLSPWKNVQESWQL